MMGEVPSLFSLCIEGIRNELVLGDCLLPYIYDLPSDLFDRLLAHLPPVALQKLQDHLPCNKGDEQDSVNDCFINQRKRKRCSKFESTWRALYKSRWPGPVRQTQPADWLAEEDMGHDEFTIDWQQKYWETHLQNCLDEAAEKAFIPCFDGCFGDIKIPDSLINYIGYGGISSYLIRESLKLSYHCQQFGLYARSLRLHNVLCSAQISQLLRYCKLESLELHWIKSKEHVDGLCKLLSEHNNTLTSVVFIHCKLSSIFLDAICVSLCRSNLQTHGIQHFSIKMSTFFENNSLSLPVGLASFILSGRSLSSLSFSDCQLQGDFVKLLLNTLLHSSSSIVVLDLSENDIAGWLSHIKWRWSPQLSSGLSKSLQSLSLLNLRSTNLQKADAECLRYALSHMPNLESLDLSDNPIEDDGIKSLIPYFVDISEKNTSLAALKLENCELSSQGVSQLLEVLSIFKKPLNVLSIGDNELGRKMGSMLGKYMATGIRALEIEDIGLGSSGFLDAQEEITEELKLVYINISKNRGGFGTAKFLWKLLSHAPKLVAVEARHNFMPLESLPIICCGLKAAKGRLKHLDLTGNTLLDQPADRSLLAECQTDGKPIIILPSLPGSTIPYDDDP